MDTSTPQKVAEGLVKNEVRHSQEEEEDTELRTQMKTHIYTQRCDINTGL